MDYEPEPKADTARQSVYRDWRISQKAMRKYDKEPGAIVGDTNDPKAFTTAQTTSVKEKHREKAARTGEVAKGRVNADVTGNGLNDAISRWAFRYDGVDAAVAKLRKGVWLSKLDLTSYFLKIPWSEAWSKKWGWFKDFRRDGGVWNGRGRPPKGWPDVEEMHKPPWRRYSNGSFGTSIMPAWASTLSGVLAGILRHCGIDCVFYVDDFLIISDTEEEGKRQLAKALKVIVDLGLATNDKVEGPSQQLEYLGLLIDTVKGEVTITKVRCARLRRAIAEVLKEGRATRSALHTLQGKLGWCGMAVRGGRAYMAGLRDVVRESKGSKPHRRLQVDESLREDLEW